MILQNLFYLSEHDEWTGNLNLFHFQDEKNIAYSIHSVIVL
jgi:hypothetical protein